MLFERRHVPQVGKWLVLGYHNNAIFELYKTIPNSPTLQTPSGHPRAVASHVDCDHFENCRSCPLAMPGQWCPWQKVISGSVWWRHGCPLQARLHRRPGNISQPTNGRKDIYTAASSNWEIQAINGARISPHFERPWPSCCTMFQAWSYHESRLYNGRDIPV